LIITDKALLLTDNSAIGIQHQRKMSPFFMQGYFIPKGAIGQRLELLFITNGIARPFQRRRTPQRFQPVVFLRWHQQVPGEMGIHAAAVLQPGDPECFL
jgi:hypothetical protein